MIYLIVGPPAAGKTTWALSRAKPGDFVVDFDRITAAFSPGDPYLQDDHVLGLTRFVRRRAIKYLVKQGRDVYITKCRPSKSELNLCLKHGATVVVVDPGRDVVLERARRERPRWLWKVVDKWYRKPPL